MPAKNSYSFDVKVWNNFTDRRFYESLYIYLKLNFVGGYPPSNHPPPPGTMPPRVPPHERLGYNPRPEGNTPKCFSALGVKFLVAHYPYRNSVSHNSFFTCCLDVGMIIF